MSFAFPAALVLVPPIFVVWLLFYRRRPRRAAVHANIAALAMLPRGRTRIVQAVQSSLFLLTFLLATLAIAEPRTPDLRTRIPVEGISIALALDVSGSMATEDFVPRSGAAPVARLSAAKSAITSFVENRTDDRLALIAFASIPITVCPPTFNHSVLRSVLGDLKPAGAGNAETNIGDAIGEGCMRLDSVAPGRRKVLVLLSDGEHNKLGESLNPLTAAALAESLHIPVYAIDCGGDPPANDAEAKAQRESGRAALEEIARTTGGRAFIANDGEQLQAAFRTIDALEREPAPSALYRRYRNYSGECGIAAFGCLMLSAFLSATVWRRRP